jgi:SAM-dependent methyltransferase
VGSERSVDDQIADHWDSRTAAGHAGRINWWQSTLIREHVNRLVAGRPFKRISQGLLHTVREHVGDRTFDLGVSVGCGVGNKEMALIREGLVQRFDLYELSPARIDRGRQLATDLGLEDRVQFRREDAFEAVSAESVDFVHWNNSLHHMLDVDAAVAWSRRVLKPLGLFYMDDFVGPTRWQWSDKSVDLGNRIREILPEKYLRNPLYPAHGSALLERTVQRRSREWVAQQDPSEAADSGRIIESVRRHFPNAQVTLTGGVVYHMTLPHMLDNFDEDDEYDRTLLRLLMLIDELCIELPGMESHYAVAFALKEQEG